MTTTLIIQARLQSTRFPRKALVDISGKKAIERTLSQVDSLDGVDHFVLAVPDNEDVSEFAPAARKYGFQIICGPSDDVLKRYLLAAEKTSASRIIRLTGDSILIAPDSVLAVAKLLEEVGADYASNIDPHSRPDGQDVEAFTIEALRLADSHASSATDREHVTPWMKRSRSLAKAHVTHNPTTRPAEHWSLDYEEQVPFFASVWEKLDSRGGTPHSFDTILKAVESIGIDASPSGGYEGLFASIWDEASCEAAEPLDLQNGMAMLARAESVIPDGSQTYSKSWRHHIRGVTPPFLESGQGSWVNDVDGNAYVDLIQGLLPNILGYAHPAVASAVEEQARRGPNFSLPNPLEVEVAEKLCDIIPCAEMVRFGRNGSDATSGAVRLARAFTSRDRIAACGYHGWHDWYVGTTSRHLGVPNAVRDLTHPFPYNDPEALDRLLGEFPGEFAAVILEPFNFVEPAPGYLQAVRDIATKHGALLIFDEVCSGFHFGLGGAQKLFGVTPDLATFGKALGNGWPISCVVGKREFMQRFDEAFFSFTFGGDAASLAAARAVIYELETGDAYSKMTWAGTNIRDGALYLADKAGLSQNFIVEGHPHWMRFDFRDESGRPDPVGRALWLQEVTRRGVLALTTFNISASLDYGAVERVLEAFAHGFKRLAYLRSTFADIQAELDGPLPVPAFRTRG